MGEVVWQTPGQVTQAAARAGPMEALGIARQGEIESGAAIFRGTAVGTATPLGVEREGITGQMPEQVGAAAPPAWAQGEVVVLAAEADSEVVAGVASPHCRP